MDNTTILSWNVRGLNAKARRDCVCTLVGDIRPTILCLQETKLDVISQYTVFSLLGVGFSEFAYLPASSTRRGILVAGQCYDVAFTEVLIGCFSVTIAMKPLLAIGEAQDSWWLTTVYGPQEDGDKLISLEELEAIHDAALGPWAVIGDFNLILHEADKSNDRIDRANLRCFK